MNSLVVSAEARLAERGGSEIHFVTRGISPPLDSRFRLSVDWPLNAPANALGDAALCLYLFQAMRLGVTLELENSVSPELLERAATLQEIFSCWNPDLFAGPIEIQAGRGETAAPPAGGRACFFSAGADSFHSALEHRDRLSHLVFVHGFDLALDDTALRARVVDSIQAASTELGLTLIQVETDIRTITNQSFVWGEEFCGAAMAGIAHLLSHIASETMIPSSFTYSQFEPFSTNCITDPMWSSPSVRVVHDGAGVYRIDKLRAIADHPTARRHLRVCWENRDGDYNCGRCEKCLRTMANLRAIGRLEQCESFPPTLDLEALRKLEIDHEWAASYLDETLRGAIVGGDSELAEATRRCITENLADSLARQAGRCKGRLPEAPDWKRKAVPRFRDSIFASCMQTSKQWLAKEASGHFANSPDAALRLLWKSSPWWLLGRIAIDTLVPRRLYKRRSHR